MGRQVKSTPCSRMAASAAGAPENGYARLQSTGYHRHEQYLAGLMPEVLEWVRLYKPVSGRVVERSFEHWSAFSLQPRDVPDNECLIPDELVLTDQDIEAQHAREIRPLPAKRIARALAQRASWLSLVNSPMRLQFLRACSNTLPQPLHPLVANPLEQVRWGETPDFKDWGYLTRFSPFKQSRDALLRDGLYSQIGKIHRSILCSAPMPDTIGSFDALWTSLSCHMLTVIPRNFGFANPERSLMAAKMLLDAASRLTIPGIEDADLIAFARDYYRRNICTALGVHEDSVKAFTRHYDLGVRCFRIYSIATDLRIRRQVKQLVREILKRQMTDDPIEFFVGQLTSLEQFDDLRGALSDEEWACIDGFFIGNGGGVRCKTAETGMIVNTPELIIGLRGREDMTGKSIVVEGGVGDEPAVALLFGASGLSHAAGIAGASIEAPNGGLFLFDGRDYWSPQRGEASPSAKIIEAAVAGKARLLYDDGEPRQVEGEVGFLRQEACYVSMCGRIRVRNEWLAQCLVKLGVRNITQLHSLGVALTRSELEKIFEMRWSELEAFGDVHALPTEYKAIETRYAIPLPVRRRTAAMRTAAQSVGKEEKMFPTPLEHHSDQE